MIKNIIDNNSKFNLSLVFKKAQLIATAFLYLFLTDFIGLLIIPL